MSEWHPPAGAPSSHLKTNLAALGRHHPALHERAAKALETTPVRLRALADGRLVPGRETGGGVVPLMDAAGMNEGLQRGARRLRELSPLGAPSLIVCPGIAPGYGFQQLYEHIRPSPRKFLLIAEPDMDWFLAAMAAVPLEAPFSSERAHWAVGPDWREQIARLADEHLLFSLNTVEVFHAGISELNPAELRRAAGAALQAASTRFQTELAAAADHYSRTPPDRLDSVMALDIQGGMAVRYIQERFLAQCRALGLRTHRFSPHPIGGTALLRAVARKRPGFLLFMNWHPGEYAPIGVLNQLRLPRVTWCIDDPYSFLKNEHVFHGHDFVWTWDGGYGDCYAARRARSVDWVPYVADLDGVEPAVRGELKSPVSYVGQVAVPDRAALGLDERLEAFARRCGFEKAANLKRSYASLAFEWQGEFGLSVIAEDGGELPPNLRYAMYVFGNAKRRIDVLERARPFGLALYGNEAWREWLAGHPLLECYRGPADPRRDVPDIFASSAVNLNIHSLQALSSLNQRDFNCPLMGGFLLTDWVEGAGQFFEPDAEMAFYHGPDDLEAKIRYYLERPGERARVTENGRRRVLREHTYAARVPAVLEQLKRRIRERYGL